MGRWSFFLAIWTLWSPVWAQETNLPAFRLGIDVLAGGGFRQLKGKRVGLVTNPSGADGKGVPADKAESIRWLTKAADSGDAISQYNLGVLYLQGLGVEKDITKGTALIKKAADQGNDVANKFLAALSQAQK
jgi:hypothetical protein